MAREAGVLDLPEDGVFGFFNVPGSFDLGGCPVAASHAVQRFRPEHDRLLARGLSVSVEAEGLSALSAAYVQLPRSKIYARALVEAAWAATAPDGIVLIDGQKTDGIDGIAKALKARVGEVFSYVKAHGRLIWAKRGAPDALHGFAPDWTARPGGFLTAPGVFSAEKIDKGSALLAAHLPPLKGRVADFGAGWGFLGAEILKSEAVEGLDLIEADAAALACARQNITDNRASFHWADATGYADGPFAAVVMNPPFHTGRAAQPDLGVAFIEAAARALSGAGALWLVANRQLPYEAALDAGFRRVETVTVGAGFKVLHAQGPRRSR